METYAAVMEQVHIDWLEVESRWDDMQWFAFLDCVIRRAERDRSKNGDSGR